MLGFEGAGTGPMGFIGTPIRTHRYPRELGPSEPVGALLVRTVVRARYQSNDTRLPRLPAGIAEALPPDSLPRKSPCVASNFVLSPLDLS